MVYKYDLFISYAFNNAPIAEHVVKQLEKKGLKCFIAPRDIQTGNEYAHEIVSAITNSIATLLIFSEEANNSHYVLREINSAVSRNKTIIPLRIQDFLPSEAMEFYLGPTHWLNAFPEILDVHIDKIISTVRALGNVSSGEKEEKEYKITNPTLIKLEEASTLGLSNKDITMKEIEIDYLVVPTDRYNMSEEINGSLGDWVEATEQYENDTSVLLIKNDEIIGYCDAYPVDSESYKILIDGKAIIRESMIDLFCVGGTFDIYVAMLAIVPSEANQNNFLMILDWLFEKIDGWRKDEVYVNNIGISIYSDLLEKFIIKFGFEFASYNPAKGKVYQINIEKLKTNPLLLKRHPNFYKD